ncbi:MAG: oligoendopeptidase F family protein [Firmicutes bacterium]|nr:oligoendopeptidase F family protein [Bacillota bacterium]
MKYSWDLKRLYMKIEDFYLDMTLIRDKIKVLCSHREIKIDGNSLYELMSECFSIREMNFKTLLYASLNYYLDINNVSNIKMKQQAEELDSFVGSETSFIDELLCVFEEDKLNLLYEENSKLLDYKFYIDTVRRNSKYFVSNNKIDNYNKLINNNLIKYNLLSKNLDFGDGINDSNIGLFLTSSDREIRNNYFHLLNNTYLSKKDDYFNIFKDIISSRKKISTEKNYSSVLELELFKEDIDSKYLDNLIKSVNDNINIMNRYLKIKCDYLSIENPRLYDINLPIGSCNNKFNLENGIKIIKDIFKVFGDEYIEIVEELFKNNYLDLECNNKKHPSIVFSWNKYSFMNYKDRYIDLKNLIHEIGHIVNSYLSVEKQLFIYSDSSVFAGEVASLVNEIMLNDYLYRNATNDEDKIFYLSKLIENFISQVYRQTMYTEFENIIYSKDELEISFVLESYLSLVKKYYGNVLEIDEVISSEWMRVGHLFRWSYYVYKYASGYVLAFNVIDKIKNNVDKYMNFLSSGCCCSNYDLFKELGIDIYDIDLFNNSFKMLNKYIDELDTLIKNKK